MNKRLILKRDSSDHISHEKQKSPAAVYSTGGGRKGAEYQGGAAYSRICHPPLLVHIHHHHIPNPREEDFGGTVAHEQQARLFHSSTIVPDDASYRRLQ